MSETKLSSHAQGRLADAFEFSNAMHTLHLAKENIKTKIENRLVYSVNGGSFVITPELISFVDLLVRRKNKTYVLQDKNDNPIEITDLKGMLNSMLDIHKTVMQEAHKELQKVQSTRNIKRAFDIDD